MNDNKLIIDQFIKLLSQLQHEIEKSTTDKDKETNEFRLKNIAKGLKIIKKFPKKITSGNDLKGISGIGKGIMSRIDEILSKGTLKEIKLGKKTEERLSNLAELKTVLGIGEKKAEELYNEGVKSVKQLKELVKENKIYVDDMIKLGLKYYGKYHESIPRSEMDSINEVLLKVMNKVSKHLHGEVLGSYRRRHEMSNDIDFVITHPKIKTIEEIAGYKKNYLHMLIKELEKEGYLIDHISGFDSHKSYRGFFQLGTQYPLRRIDISFIPYNSYPTSLLHFTGSSQFNEKIRNVAKSKGYKLNRYGLFKVNKDNDEVEQINVKSEKDIFKKLGMKYVKPEDRDS
jgi:DNA polymerase/3'-5' exonuclease PolX